MVIRNHYRNSFLLWSALLIFGTWFLLSGTAQAHAPRLISSQDFDRAAPLVINDPDISQAFYARLDGQAEYYYFSWPGKMDQSDSADGSFYFGLLVPDKAGTTKDFSAELIRVSDNQVLVDLSSVPGDWTPYFEPFGGDHYFKGPEYEVSLPVGDYIIKVDNPSQSGQYVLVVGLQESFSLEEVARTLLVMPALKDYFGRSPGLAYFNYVGLFLLLSLVALLLIICIACKLWRRAMKSGFLFRWKSKRLGLWLFAAAVALGSLTPARAADRIIIQEVPFTSQAPTGQWRDARQQDGCEEAVAAMAMAWVGNEKNISASNWRLRILILSTFEKKKYGEYRYVTTSDIVDWLFKDYFRYQGVELKTVSSAADIIKELEQGNLVLTPMNGRLLKNPYFSGSGPERHMILIKGYDYQTREFITNDPGTKRGNSYRYPEKIIFNAIRVYATGYHQAFGKLTKEMIVVRPKPVVEQK